MPPKTPTKADAAAVAPAARAKRPSVGSPTPQSPPPPAQGPGAKNVQVRQRCAISVETNVPIRANEATSGTSFSRHREKSQEG